MIADVKAIEANVRLSGRVLPARHVELDCEQVLIPCLVESGLFRISRKLYGEIGPAFYGLRTTLLTLLLVALLRIKRPEHLKERDPARSVMLIRSKCRMGSRPPTASLFPDFECVMGHLSKREFGGLF